MLDEIEVEITKKTVGSALIVTIDTEYVLKTCTLTKKYEAKIITDSGVTRITESLVPKDGKYLAVIWKHTRYAFKVCFLEANEREDIIV